MQLIKRHRVLQAYKEALEALQTGDFDSTAPRAYSSLYAQLAATNPGMVSAHRVPDLQQQVGRSASN